MMKVDDWPGQFGFCYLHWTSLRLSNWAKQLKNKKTPALLQAGV
jgi:hypothetical protein